MIEIRVHCPACGARYSVSTEYTCPYCYGNYAHSEDLRDHIEDCHISKTKPGPWTR